MLTIYLHRTGLAEGQLAGFVGHTDEVFSATRQGEKLPTVVVEVQGFCCFCEFEGPIRKETLGQEDTFCWIILILSMGNETANEG
jgi:hypothetical protein